MNKYIINLNDEELKELQKINFENTSRWTILQMLINKENIGLSLIEKFMKEYIEEQTKAELIRQDLLNKYKPEGIIVRYNIDLVNNKLIVFTGEEQ